MISLLRDFRSFFVLPLLFLTTALPLKGELKHVVVMIADGWSYNQIVATNAWLGTANQPYEQFPVRLFMSTYSLTKLLTDSLGYDADRARTDFNYLLLRGTDSAASVTAISTGVKGWDSCLSVDPVTFEPLPTILERAEELGLSTGVVTSVPISHATPAGFAAHDVKRSNYGQIAIEMIDSSGCEVIMGCGHPYFDNNGEPIASPDPKAFHYVGSAAKWSELKNGTAGGENPFTLIQSRLDFQKLAEGPTPNRVCGVAQVHSTLQQRRTPEEPENSFTPPFTVPPLNSVPTLSEMTRGALNVLDNNVTGFFLMVEGGAIDWAGHSNQAGRTIEEMIQFSEVVQAVIDWVESKSSWEESLVIVTGDHETGLLLGLDSGPPAVYNPLINNGKGTMPGGRYYSENHSNMLIPFFAKGEGSQWFDASADLVDSVFGRYLDNTEITSIIFKYYNGYLPFVSVRDLEYQQATDGVVIRWKAVPGCDSYRIYHSNQETVELSNENLIATVADTSFVFDHSSLTANISGSFAVEPWLAGSENLARSFRQSIPEDSLKLYNTDSDNESSPNGYKR